MAKLVGLTTPIPFDFDFQVVKSAESIGGTTDLAPAVETKGDWIVEGFAATADLDRQDDEIEHKAIEEAAKDLATNSSTVLFNHAEDRPIAKLIHAEGREGGLFVRAVVSKSEPLLWQKILDGTINKFSIRGKILDAVKRWVEETKSYVRVIRKMTLVEVSLVSVPANPRARTLRAYVAKALDGFEKSAGKLPVEGRPDRGESMSKEKLVLDLSDTDRSRASKIVELAGAVVLIEKDGTRIEALKHLGELAGELASSERPTTLTTDSIRKALADSVRNGTFASIATITAALLVGTTDANCKKGLENVLDLAAPADPAAQPKPVVVEKSGDCGCKSQGAGAAGSTIQLSAAPPANPQIEELKSVSATLLKVAEVFERVSKAAAPPPLHVADPKAGDAVRAATNGACPDGYELRGDGQCHRMTSKNMIPANDGKCPEGYEFMDGMCHVKSMAPQNDGKCPDGYSLKDGRCVLAKSMAPEPKDGKCPDGYDLKDGKCVKVEKSNAEEIAVAVAKALAPLTKQLEKFTAASGGGIRKSLNGQENAEGGSASSGGLAKVFRDVASGALRRAGVNRKDGK